MASKRFVYVLRSATDPDRHYVGLTSDVPARLRWHNAGPSGVTVRHRPWSLVVSLEFANGRTAGSFERYLKTGSGRAFAKRHFSDQLSPPPRQHGKNDGHEGEDAQDGDEQREPGKEAP